MIFLLEYLMFCPSYLRKEKFVSIQLYPNRILSVQLNSLQYIQCSPVNLRSVKFCSDQFTSVQCRISTIRYRSIKIHLRLRLIWDPCSKTPLWTVVQYFCCFCFFGLLSLYFVILRWTSRSCALKIITSTSYIRPYRAPRYLETVGNILRW